MRISLPIDAQPIGILDNQDTFETLDRENDKDGVHEEVDRAENVWRRTFPAMSITMEDVSIQLD